MYVNTLIGSEELVPPSALQRRIDDVLATSDADPETLNKTLARAVAQLTSSLVMAHCADRDPFMIGMSNLMVHPEFHAVERMLGLTEFFDHFDTMFERMVPHADGRPDVQVMIGSENPVPAIRQEATIIARYRLPHRQEGTLTLVGPMRMDYRRNISLLRYVVHVMNGIIHT
jgi:heat-inducible transcriptional repressor